MSIETIWDLRSFAASRPHSRPPRTAAHRRVPEATNGCFMTVERVEPRLGYRAGLDNREGQLRVGSGCSIFALERPLRSIEFTFNWKRPSVPQQHDVCARPQRAIAVADLGRNPRRDRMGNGWPVWIAIAGAFSPEYTADIARVAENMRRELGATAPQGKPLSITSASGNDVCVTTRFDARRVAAVGGSVAASSLPFPCSLAGRTKTRPRQRTGAELHQRQQRPARSHTASVSVKVAGLQEYDGVLPRLGPHRRNTHCTPQLG